MSNENDVLVSQSDSILTLTINRPHSRNGLTPGTCERLAEAIETIGDDVRCIVITGAGQAFCSGADLVDAMKELGQRSHKEVLESTFHRVIRAIAQCEIPVLASMRGAAVGFGFDLALACDLRIASRDSKMGAVFTRIGLVPDGGSSFTLSRLVGLARAMELVLLAETFDGVRASELGVVNKVVDDGDLESATLAWAERLAAGPPMAYRLAKRNIRAGSSTDLNSALANEVEAQIQCLASEDAMEGVAAFLQKRKPVFKGK